MKRRERYRFARMFGLPAIDAVRYATDRRVSLIVTGDITQRGEFWAELA